MDAPAHQILFKGEIQTGETVENVKKKLSISLKISEDKVEALFSGRVLILRKNIDLDKAIKFKKRFDKTGAICIISQPANKNQEVKQEYHIPDPESEEFLKMRNDFLRKGSEIIMGLNKSEPSDKNTSIWWNLKNIFK